MMYIQDLNGLMKESGLNYALGYDILNIIYNLCDSLVTSKPKYLSPREWFARYP